MRNNATMSQRRPSVRRPLLPFPDPAGSVRTARLLSGPNQSANSRASPIAPETAILIGRSGSRVASSCTIRSRTNGISPG